MIRLIDFLICDDIRFEQSGKFTLVGVYPDGIAVALDPAGPPVGMPRLGVFIRVVLGDDQPPPDGFKVRCFMGDEEVLTFQGAMEVENLLRPVTMPLVSQTPVQLKPGELAAELIFLRGETVVASLCPEKLPIIFTKPPADAGTPAP